MKLRYDDALEQTGYPFVETDDGTVMAEVIFFGRYNQEVSSELSRRVNGWEALVAFVKPTAQLGCNYWDEHLGDCRECFSCRARAALREAGIDE